MNGLEYARMMSAKMRAKYPERWRARSILNSAIAAGRICARLPVGNARALAIAFVTCRLPEVA